jgi:hypothetical protein
LFIYPFSNHSNRISVWGFSNLTSDVKQNRRKRGAQKGNQNARKHGFYSSTLSPDEIRRFLDITNQEIVDSDIVVLRVKLQSFLQNDPGNRRVLREISKLLVKLYGKKYQLNRSDRNYLKTLIEDILEQYIGASPSKPEQPAVSEG